MLKNRLFTSVFMMLAMAGVANAAYNGTPATPKTDTDGCYVIGSAEELYGFANMVNNQNKTYGAACAKLTADIVVNEHVLTDEQGNSKVNSDGSYKTALGVPANEWTPIGNNIGGSQIPFSGSFDGQGHTISGLYINKPHNDEKK